MTFDDPDTNFESANNASADSFGHIPILVPEILACLQPQAGDGYADLTVGRGGHALAFAEAVGPTGCIAGFDLDAANLRFAEARLNDHPNPDVAGVKTFFRAGNFVTAPRLLDEEGITADIVLADLGFASNQMDDPSRGLSFQANGPLDMRLDPTGRVTAAEVVNDSSEQELADLIFRYGEDPYSRQIARAILEARQDTRIESTSALSEIVRKAYGWRASQSRMHPATRTFMALRIAVNNELGNLESLCKIFARPNRSVNWLSPRARIGIMSFHSLEDRMVKQMIAQLVQDDVATKLTRKPIVATDAEIRVNPRSRSAKFRAFQLNLPT